MPPLEHGPVARLPARERGRGGGGRGGRGGTAPLWRKLCVVTRQHALTAAADFFPLQKPPAAMDRTAMHFVMRPFPNRKTLACILLKPGRGA